MTTRGEKNRQVKQAAFLSSLRRTGNVTAAARDAGVSRSTYYRWIDIDPEYAGQVEAVSEELADELEQEARRRALEGVEEPVFRGGERVGTIRKFSDSLLLAMLRAKRPEQFRDSVDVTNRLEDGMTAVNPEVLKTMTEDEVKAARELLRRLFG